MTRRSDLGHIRVIPTGSTVRVELYPGAVEDGYAPFAVHYDVSSLRVVGPVELTERPDGVRLSKGPVSVGWNAQEKCLYVSEYVPVRT